MVSYVDHRDLSPDGGGCNDGHALAGVKLGGILNVENSVINMVLITMNLGMRYYKTLPGPLPSIHPVFHRYCPPLNI